MEAAAASGRGTDRRSVTDGRWWALVCARDGEMAASGIVDALTWVEEREVRDAFLDPAAPATAGRRQSRRTGCPRCSSESVAAAEEITEALGAQVRRAVELLVQCVLRSRRGRRAAAANRDPLPADRDEMYEAAVTVMMRVVFLLFAEERGLLPQGRTVHPADTGSAASSTPSTAGRGRSARKPSTRTYLTWHRLLATSQALYARSVVRGHAAARRTAAPCSTPPGSRSCCSASELGTLRDRVSATA